MAADVDVGRLVEPMLKKRLFVAISRAVASQEEMKPHVADHLRWMRRMEAEGKLFASGPFPQEGVEVGDGLTILQAGDHEEAVRMMEEEPLTRLGLRSYELRAWELREGRMTVTLSASTSSYSL